MCAIQTQQNAIRHGMGQLMPVSTAVKRLSPKDQVALKQALKRTRHPEPHSDDVLARSRSAHGTDRVPASLGQPDRLSILPLQARCVQQPAAQRCSIKARNETLLPILKARKARKILSAEDQLDDIAELRSILGIDSHKRGKRTILLAIDVEAVGSHHVSEIGLTILKSYELKGTDAGSQAVNWMAKTESHHLAIGKARKPAAFTSSRQVTDDQAALIVVDLLRALISEGADQIALVGHAIESDLGWLARSAELRLDILKLISPGQKCQIFDTYSLASRAKREGANLASLRLGHLLSQLRAERKDKTPVALQGLHNAANDAFYTMNALLLLALRWNELVNRGRSSVRNAAQNHQNQKGTHLQQERAGSGVVS